MTAVKIVLGVIAGIHGLIHLMGFVKAFRLAGLEQLSMDISRPAGILWLVAAVLFVLVAVLVLAGRGWWWMVAGPALVLSQVLVVLTWRDAKFGTIANLIVLVAAVLGYGAWSFQKMASAEVHSLVTGANSHEAAISEEQISDLPPVVRKWLRRSGVVGREASGVVALTQTGQMRTAPDGKWMPFKARQWFSTDPPGFLWLADVAAAPGIHLAGRDKYMDGRGHMLIKLLSLVPVADARGPEIDQDALLRFLAEMIWFPSAALSDYIKWEQLDDHTARASMRWKGISAPGVFRFHEDGRVESFSARRHYDRDEGATLEDWLVEVDPESHKEFAGRSLPIRGSVTWKLKEGDFEWLRLKVTDIRDVSRE